MSPRSPTDTRTAAGGDGPPPHVLLLLSHRATADDMQSRLRARLARVQVSRASDLGEAMLAVSASGPALAVLDAALCDALEREFVEHLLRTAPEATVLVLGGDGAPWPAHPRLVRLTPAEVPLAIDRWLDGRRDSRARVAGQGSAA